MSIVTAGAGNKNWQYQSPVPHSVEQGPESGLRMA